MKRIVLMVCAAFVILPAMAQPSALKVATDKTSSLIFPFSIRYVDIGTKNVWVQQVPEADSILLFKAAFEKFPETNLSVVTGDGSFYSFRLLYHAAPDTLVYHIPALNKINVSTYATGLVDNPRTMVGMYDRRFGMTAAISGIYVKDEVMYFQLEIENTTAIDYSVDLLKFYTRDKSKGKRTAVQENEMIPLFISGNTKVVKAYQKNKIVVALDKFTIPDKKLFTVQVLEKNGGRHLHLKVTNRKIIKAILLPGLY